MLRERWDVISRRRACGLVMSVDLRLIAKVCGPRISPWNRTARCRRLGCPGIVDFQAKAPGMASHEPLQTPWPE
ncbi:MAG TPA: hypothetical protein VGS12_00235 [Caulobacteraceae bacterium]|nr:hypothetical protein [Caulobacteraceae bacterium]